MEKFKVKMKKIKGKVSKILYRPLMFIQCNFRIVLTIGFVAVIAYIYQMIAKHPFIDELSKNMKFAAVFSIITTAILLAVIFKTVRDFLRIKLQDKGKGSLIEKTSTKRK